MWLEKLVGAVFTLKVSKKGVCNRLTLDTETLLPDCLESRACTRRIKIQLRQRARASTLAQAFQQLSSRFWTFGPKTALFRPQLSNAVQQMLRNSSFTMAHRSPMAFLTTVTFLPATPKTWCRASRQCRAIA